MIRVCLWRGADGAPERLTVSGHAGQDRYGEDIVCAAASALVETLVLGLRDVVGEPPGGRVNPGDADITFLHSQSREARAVVDTIARGLQDLAASEPKAAAFEERYASN